LLIDEDLQNMLRQSNFSRGSNNTADNQIFVYEVTGLRQNAVIAQCEYKVRNSANLFMRVPFDRMSKTMQRIVDLGGKIVSIHPLAHDAVLAAEAAPTRKKKH
jgi:phycocyanin-associated, rod